MAQHYDFTGVTDPTMPQYYILPKTSNAHKDKSLSILD